MAASLIDSKVNTLNSTCNAIVGALGLAGITFRLTSCTGGEDGGIICCPAMAWQCLYLPGLITILVNPYLDDWIAQSFCPRRGKCTSRDTPTTLL